MSANSKHLRLEQTGALLRGDSDVLVSWTEHFSGQRVLLCLFLIISGSSLYGAAMGIWRAPMQAVFTALKFPLIILLTTFGNALLNGMLAPLLGLNISFRQSLMAILMSFTIASIILAEFSPLILFAVWNTPPMQGDTPGSIAIYSFLQLAETGGIAFAGVMANLRLVQLLQRLSGSDGVAWKILIAWLAGNLFLGAQISWILRPIMGSPVLEVEFLRPNAFHGSFYEAVFGALKILFPF